ncbi:MAG: homoserine dehydrogenase [Candidatus Parvarchaeota archaeon]
MVELRIILVGCGVVNLALLKIFLKHRERLIARFGLNPQVVAVADSKGVVVNEEGIDIAKVIKVKKNNRSVIEFNELGKIHHDVIKAIESVDAEVVIEAIPSNINDGEPSVTYIKSAFKHGKHAITTNKGSLALFMSPLLELARYNDVMFKFSGAVGGGTPMIDFAKKCLVGDDIISIRGILNGTTNYILTQMQKGIRFDRALQNAKRRGYVEVDPSIDIDGLDAACKLVILANVAMGKKVTLAQVKIRGIREVHEELIKEAGARGSTIRLVATARDDLRVAPEEICVNDPIAVDGVLNAVTFTSRYAGDQTIIGRGAGGTETASAILRDLLDIRAGMQILGGGE